MTIPPSDSVDNHLQITFRHLDPTLAIKNHCFQRAEKFRPFLRPESQLKLILGTEKQVQYAELELLESHHRFFSREEGADLYVSIDQVFDRVLRQVKEDHDKVRESRRVPKHG